MSCVLAVETSCDETAVALYDDSGLIAHEIYSQIPLHQHYGGVVPEIASRDHVAKLLPLIEMLCFQAKRDLSSIDAFAYTRGPGLIGALMVGSMLSRSLAFALSKPAIGVHHLEAHLMAVHLEERAPVYPYISLLVSGGHTMLIDVQGFSEYRIIGETRDDAVGEVFDKVAKLMGLGYPGGPVIEKLALNGEACFKFSRPMVNVPGCEFSFSGLKSQVARLYQELDNKQDQQANIAASFQRTVVDTLRIKSERALELTGYKNLVVVGGVSANQYLRDSFKKTFEAKGISLYYPKKEFCTDNAAMVAYCGFERLKRGLIDVSQVKVLARWPLDSLSD